MVASVHYCCIASSANPALSRAADAGPADTGIVRGERQRLCGARNQLPQKFRVLEGRGQWSGLPSWLYSLVLPSVPLHRAVHPHRHAAALGLGTPRAC